MTLAERHSPGRRSSKSPQTIEDALLAIIAGAFLLFNILVGVMVHRALPTESGGAETIVLHGD
jgi:hypothetical protein